MNDQAAGSGGRGLVHGMPCGVISRVGATVTAAAPLVRETSGNRHLHGDVLAGQRDLHQPAVDPLDHEGHDGVGSP
jgi:hypothetical protein